MREDMLEEMMTALKRSLQAIEEAETVLSKACSVSEEIAFSQYFSSEERNRLNLVLETISDVRSKTRTSEEYLYDALREVSKIEA